VALVYQCPYCRQYVSILSPHCHACHKKLPSSLRFIAIAGTVAAVAPHVARRYPQAIEKTLSGGSDKAPSTRSADMPAPKRTRSADTPAPKPRHDVIVSPCGHAIGIGGDPAELWQKQIKCYLCNDDDPPRTIVAFLSS